MNTPASNNIAFIVDPAKCDPSQWRPGDLLAFSEFLRSGDANEAAVLEGLGLRVVGSDAFEHVGWKLKDTPVTASVRDIAELFSGPWPASIVRVQRVYRGPVVYAIQVPTGSEGDAEEYQVEVFDIVDEAKAFLEGYNLLYEDSGNGHGVIAGGDEPAEGGA